jgi:hypothetical protein
MINALAAELGGDGELGEARCLAEVRPKLALRRRPSGLSLAIFADAVASSGSLASAQPWAEAAAGKGVGASRAGAPTARAVSDEDMAISAGQHEPPSHVEARSGPGHRRVLSAPSPLSFPECESGAHLSPLRLSPLNNGSINGSINGSLNGPDQAATAEAAAVYSDLAAQEG